MAKKQLGALATAAEDAITKGELAAVVSRVFLSTDQVNANATANTLADVTGLSFPVVAGKYWFKFSIVYDAAATTTGARFVVDGPTLTRLAMKVYIPTSGATPTLTSVVSYNVPSAALTSSLAANNPVTMEGFIEVSASGSVIVRFASEIASSAITVIAGSYVEYFKVP